MLTLPIKKKWFDMILSGEKKEEYREMKPYYTSRFRNYTKTPIMATDAEFKYVLMKCPETVEIMFRNGYSNDRPFFVAKCDLGMGQGNTEWGAEPNKEYYVLKILEIKEVSL